jgi:hypothetical protein
MFKLTPNLSGTNAKPRVWASLNNQKLVLRKKKKKMEKVDDFDSVTNMISTIAPSQVGPNLCVIPKRAS